MRTVPRRCLTGGRRCHPIRTHTDCNVPESTTIGTPPADDPDRFPFTDDHRMLLRIRDTPYEGSWDDFVHDLRARAEGRPHVFEIVPASEPMKATIAGHLTMIEHMQSWEAAQGRALRADEGNSQVG
jgi:hypothetical protein